MKKFKVGDKVKCIRPYPDGVTWPKLIANNIYTIRDGADWENYILLEEFPNELKYRASEQLFELYEPKEDNPFKVGDEVVCIDNKDPKIPFEIGEILTVAGLYPGGIIIGERTQGYVNSRFKLHEKQPVKLKVIYKVPRLIILE